MADRYCPYHQGFVADEGFKVILHPSSGTQRGMCPACQARRKQPRAELQALADSERAARSAKASRAALEARQRKEQ